MELSETKTLGVRTEQGSEQMVWQFVVLKAVPAATAVILRRGWDDKCKNRMYGPPGTSYTLEPGVPPGTVAPN